MLSNAPHDQCGYVQTLLSCLSSDVFLAISSFSDSLDVNCPTLKHVHQHQSQLPRTTATSSDVNPFSL